MVELTALGSKAAAHWLTEPALRQAAAVNGIRKLIHFRHSDTGSVFTWPPTAAAPPVG
ncbi:MAG TPA: hypothetical protein VLW50_14040 [Streptosporangiaceae bacterium]|nr:hypothetical protein [Streptosporangiaceae bacterium]